MYYCKKCGKSLPDDARFCDRCNTSVRSQGGKKELIEDLKEERLARRKAKAVEERLRKIKKIKSKRMKLIIGSVIALVVLGVASAVVTNIVFTKTSSITGPIDTVHNTTEETPQPTETASEEANIINSEGYIVTSIYDVSFAYPSSFTADSSNTGGGMVLGDSVGDAKLVVYRTTAALTSPSDAMKSCIETKDLVSPTATVTDNTYSVTGTRGENIYHRFSRITEDTELYYELIYPGASSRAAEYEEYIRYMDSYLEAQ